MLFVRSLQVPSGCLSFLHCETSRWDSTASAFPPLTFMGLRLNMVVRALGLSTVDNLLMLLPFILLKVSPEQWAEDHPEGSCASE